MIEDISANAEQAAMFLKGLANPQRLMILCLLAEGETNVSELIAATGIPQTSMSQHLNKLKDENIVDFRREHRSLFYRLEHPAALKIMTVLHDEYCAK